MGYFSLMKPMVPLSGASASEKITTSLKRIRVLTRNTGFYRGVFADRRDAKRHFIVFVRRFIITSMGYGILVLVYLIAPDLNDKIFIT